MHTILMTGATGNVGSSLVSEVGRRGLPLRAFVRDPGRAAAILGPDVRLAVGDLGDPASIRAALDGVEVVFLACGNVPRQPEYEVNVIDAAARAGALLPVTPTVVRRRPARAARPGRPAARRAAGPRRR